MANKVELDVWNDRAKAKRPGLSAWWFLALVVAAVFWWLGLDQVIRLLDVRTGEPQLLGQKCVVAEEQDSPHYTRWHCVMDYSDGTHRELDKRVP